MPDISMCHNSTCPLASRCYRQLAAADAWQSYMAFEWSEENGGIKCDGFIDVDERRCVPDDDENN